jgi:superfamily II DNA/RNA helicase
MPKDVGCIYGGVHKSLQMNDLFRKVVVATPGRLIDFLRRHALHFDFVVIDEADRILEGNFMEQLDEIIQGIGKYEQMLMFTATVTREVDELIRKYIKDPVKLTIGGSNSFNANIKQEIVMSRSISSKRDEMLSILREYRGYKVLIFTNTKSKTQELCQ